MVICTLIKDFIVNDSLQYRLLSIHACPCIVTICAPVIVYFFHSLACTRERCLEKPSYTHVCGDMTCVCEEY